MQSDKIQSILSDTAKIIKNPFRLKRLEMLSVVFPEYLCTVEIMDIWTGEYKEFPIRNKFFKDIIPGIDSFVVLIREIDNSGAFVENDWERVSNARNVATSSHSSEFIVPVKPSKNVRIRVDIHKKGWSEYVPISLLGIDTREFENPPSQLGFWIFFKSEPIIIDRLAFSRERIRNIIEENKLMNALLSNNYGLIIDSIQSTTENPDNGIFGLKPSFFTWLNSNSIVRYRTAFPYSDKDFYGLSFLQSGCQINIAKEP